jgi:hypothetical protein
MNEYYVNRGEQRATLTVPVQQNGAKPSPVPTAATMKLQHRVTGTVLTRSMAVDTTPTDRVNLVYDWQTTDWTGPNPIATGSYRAWWMLTVAGETTVVPAQGWDVLWVGDAP